MVDVLRSFEPLMLPRPRGAHRYDVFSPKLGRRLTLYRRSAFEAWLMLKADPASMTFCERPGCMAVDEQHRVVDFWVKSYDREYLVVLSEVASTDDRPQNRIDFDPEAFGVRHIDAAERAAVAISLCAMWRALREPVSSTFFNKASDAQGPSDCHRATFPQSHGG
ncbi:hypothetical protein [Paraburkholderia strydomiana]|uniref:hypothetical protein n=1 Tax=Paraburkholderia strydomiana TaxID=1245417 RepID=UPI001BECC048|nr:hypothetical protein [Paraburkholderia strydomiana]MBT2792823.1 hypothetical protein [Paraburkholderia strydomiana]